jgi:hypothetical protein
MLSQALVIIGLNHAASPGGGAGRGQAILRQAQDERLSPGACPTSPRRALEQPTVNLAHTRLL